MNICCDSFDYLKYFNIRVSSIKFQFGFNISKKLDIDTWIEISDFT